MGILWIYGYMDILWMYGYFIDKWILFPYGFMDLSMNSNPFLIHNLVVVAYPYTF